MSSISAFLIRVFYWLRLRPVANAVQRWIAGEHKAPVWPIPVFARPEHVEGYAQARFDWREDAVGSLPLDYVSKPEVFQYRLDSGSAEDGDCDDYHRWFAEALRSVPGVGRIMLLSTGYSLLKGHTTCLFEQGGAWYHVDYLIRPIDSPNDAPQYVADKYGEGRVVWYIFETPEHRALAISPSKVDE